MIPLLALALQLTGPPDSRRFRPEDIDALPLALTLVEEHEGRLVIELPPIEVPAAGTIRTPVYRATVPFAVSLYGFAVDVVDEMGRTLPPDRLHRFTLYDPDRSALFAPLALPIFAASKESPRPVLPKFLIGVPLPASSRYIAGAMFANPETRPRRMRVRVTLSFVRPGRIFPPFRGYPWSMEGEDMNLPGPQDESRWWSAPLWNGVAGVVHLGKPVRQVQEVRVRP